jgi:predicted nucleotide-binding protein
MRLGQPIMIKTILNGLNKLMDRDSSIDLFYPSITPEVSPKEIIELLERQRNKGAELLKSKFLSKENLQNWNHSTKEILTKGFDDPNFVDSILHLTLEKAFPAYEPESNLEKQRRENFRITLDMLGNCIDHLQSQGKAPLKIDPSKETRNAKEEQKITLGLEDEEDEEKYYDDEDDENHDYENRKEDREDLKILRGKKETESGEMVEDMGKLKRPKVLMTHGRDEEKNFDVAEFLKKLDLDLINTPEQSDSGFNLIEQFEKHSAVDFAVILLTGDDIAYPKGKSKEPKPRPAQNVIFELGFLIGRLRKNLVCGLYEEGLDLPSEYEKSIFIPYDEDGLWKLLVARTMKMAGVDVDLNAAL